MEGHSHNTQTQSIKPHKADICTAPNPSTPALRGGTMPVFEHAPCSLQSMESIHSICPSIHFIHPHQYPFKYNLSI